MADQQTHDHLAMERHRYSPTKQYYESLNDFIS